MRHIRKLLLIAVAAATLPTLVPLASARPVANRNIVQTAVAAKQFKREQSLREVVSHLSGCSVIDLRPH